MAPVAQFPAVSTPAIVDRGGDAGPEVPAEWTRWCVAPQSAFEVQDRRGHVGLVQVDDVNFVVTTGFRFADPAVKAMLVEQVERGGPNEQTARAMVEDAATYAIGTEDKTDIASIPRFMRWFENTYGRHTLAAIIHDRLIVSGRPNDGALASDILSDRFFREMMGSAGVPALKRWIMWAAVAMRTRWAARGWRRLTLALWLLLAVSGITLFVAAIGSALFKWPHLLALDPWVALLIAVVMPFVSAPLWGRQLGASFLAAVAALWILPAAILAVLGYLVYRVLERITKTFGSA